MLDFPHRYDPKHSRHYVETAGELPHRLVFHFDASKHSALYLRIGDVHVAKMSFTGNLSAKVERARELLERFSCDAGVLRDVVDTGIAQHVRKASDLRQQAEDRENDACKLRALEL